MATGDTLKSTKAVAAAALGFLAPGAAYLIGVGDNGITSSEWVVGALYCVAAGTVTGGVVHFVENKQKVGA